jgi:capsular exopolysaccharide synthesis family protein
MTPMSELTSQSTTSDELDLSHYLEVVMRRRWIVISGFTIVFVSTLLYTFTTRPVFEASTLLVIEKERGGSAVSADGTMIESSNEDYYQTQYKLFKSESLMRQVYEKLQLDKTEDFAQPHGLQKLEKALTVAPVLRSRLVYVKAASHDPALAARVVNSLAKTFVEQNLTNQLFISKEVLQALQINSDDVNAKQTYGSLPAVVNNALIQQLKGEDARLQSQYADLFARFTPKHPDVIALKANITSLEARIETETERIVQSLKTELSGQLKGNNVRIIDTADVPEHPVRPKKKVALIVGLLSGLGLGLGLAFLIEMLDQTVRTQEDVENKLRLPFLGQIPHKEVARGEVYQSLLSKELSLSSEAVRNVRTMVDFASVTQNSKAIMLTSTIQGEGKSYVSSNLAVAFCQLGEKVLLISGDLRRPSIHKNFGVSTERGLSDFLAKGQRVEELADLVQESEVPGVHVLSSGPRPPNPSELLNTPRLGALMAWAKSNYDRVIVDCTPMYPIHDTLLWGRHVNSAVFVVRYGNTRAPLVTKACQRLQEGGVKILGAVVNAAKATGLTYSSYGYYYQQYYHAYEQESAAPRA